MLSTTFEFSSMRHSDGALAYILFTKAMASNLFFSCWGIWNGDLFVVLPFICCPHRRYIWEVGTNISKQMVPSLSWFFNITLPTPILRGWWAISWVHSSEIGPWPSAQNALVSTWLHSQPHKKVSVYLPWMPSPGLYRYAYYTYTHWGLEYATADLWKS